MLTICEYRTVQTRNKLAMDCKKKHFIAFLVSDKLVGNSVADTGLTCQGNMEISGWVGRMPKAAEGCGS